MGSGSGELAEPDGLTTGPTFALACAAWLEPKLTCVTFGEYLEKGERKMWVPGPGGDLAVLM